MVVFFSLAVGKLFLSQLAVEDWSKSQCTDSKFCRLKKETFFCKQRIGPLLGYWGWVSPREYNAQYEDLVRFVLWIVPSNPKCKIR